MAIIRREEIVDRSNANRDIADMNSLVYKIGRKVVAVEIVARDIDVEVIGEIVVGEVVGRHIARDIGYRERRK